MLGKEEQVLIYSEIRVALNEEVTADQDVNDSEFNFQIALKTFQAEGIPRVKRRVQVVTGHCSSIKPTVTVRTLPFTELMKWEAMEGF